jgi:hypothetical protein
MSALGKKVHHSELDPQNTRLTVGNPLTTQAEDPTDSTQALKDFIEANYPAAYEQALDRLIREGHQP